MAYIPNGGKGIPDSNYYLATAQAIPTDGADDISENRIDLVNTAPNLRGMRPVRLKCKITTKVSVASGTSSTMYINLLTDASGTSTIGAHSTVAKAMLTLGYNDAKGTVYEAAIPPKAVDAYERYLAASLEPVGDDTLYSAGAIDLWLEFA